MPYVFQEKRDKYEEAIASIVKSLRKESSNDALGAANYIISSILAKGLGPHSTERWRYYMINDIMGVFASAQAEFYRRIGSRIENSAMENNGDIEAYLERVAEDL